MNRKWDAFENEIEVEYKDEEDETTEKETVAEVHSKIEVNIEETKINCRVCGELMHKKSISRHINRKHKSINLSCQFCGVRISNLVKLTEHVAKIQEEGSKEVECEMCGKPYKNIQVLQYHKTTKL